MSAKKDFKIAFRYARIVWLGRHVFKEPRFAWNARECLYNRIVSGVPASVVIKLKQGGFI